MIQKFEQASDEVVETGLDSYPVVNKIREHPLAKFVGLLSNPEAAELERSITADCGQIDWTEW
ncbi:hypothetical protein [Laspinema olomoucense]|uniref:hypothetical protein n=1 Tax=Laspinema olomoucense TaxID=3231600 RepID=UPI0021BBAD84|nr:hypothetical protein [Laspinema sp. D3a]MCT7990121.1 hypothetical protein [Laspinema sp. D3a]